MKRESCGSHLLQLTKVELAVDFLTVDNVELVRHAGLHVAHLKVEPLVVVVCVHVAVEYQVILILTNLHTTKRSYTHGLPEIYLYSTNIISEYKNFYRHFYHKFMLK